MASIANQKNRVTQLLLGYDADPNIPDSHGNTPLIYATHEGNISLINQLLQNDININFQNNAGFTALAIAVGRNGSKDITELLINNDADVNLPNIKRNNETPLLLAIKNGKNNIVKLLIDNHAFLNNEHNIGNETINGHPTPMFTAIDSRNKTALDYLIQADADLNLQDKDGDTALMMAVYNKDKHVLLSLLRAGADKTIKNNEGLTAFDLAVHFRYKGFADLLKLEDQSTIDVALDEKAKEITSKTILIAALNNDTSSTISLIKSHPGLINVQDSDGFTALIYAVNNNNVNLIEFLINEQAKLDTQNNNGYTALMIAASKGYDAIVEMLIGAKANLNIKGKDKNTALSIAIQRKKQNIIDLLINTPGINTDIQHNNGLMVSPKRKRGWGGVF